MEGCAITKETNTTDDFPIRLNTFKSVCHLLIATTGITLNFFIAFAIIAYRRLHNKPRNILWLGVTLANLLTSFTILVEFLAYHYRSVVMCKIFVSITGLAYTWLLFNLLLALIDRYVAIAHPLWHRENISVVRVIIGQGVGGLLIVLLIKLPFAIGVIPLECGIIVLHSKIIAVSNFVLLILCIITQFVVYVKTRRCLGTDNRCDSVVSFVNPVKKQRRDVSGENEASSSYERRQGEASNSGGSSRCERANLEANATTSGYGSSLLIRHVNGTRQMELEATWSLLIGVLSLLVFTCPTLIIGFIDWGCRRIYGDCSLQCKNISAATFYAREILLGHLVYNPIVYIIRSREFSSTLKEKCRTRRRENRSPLAAGAPKLRLIHAPKIIDEAPHHHL